MAHRPNPRASWWAFLAIPLVLGVSACGSEAGVEPAEPFCGDGVKAEDELCDDGNQTAGDGCSPECVPSGTELECVLLLEGHWDNRANALLPMPDQTFVVAGELTVGYSTYGWIGRYRESGEVLWFQQLDGEGGIDAVTPDGGDGNWALVRNGESPELRHFNRDGFADETIDIDSAFEIATAKYALEYVEGSMWMGGGRQGDFWLGRYDLTTHVGATLVFEDHLGFNDEVRAIGRSANQVVAAATVSTSPNFNGDILLTATTDILLLRFDLLGNEIGRVLSATDPDIDSSAVAEDIVSDGHGRWFAGGAYRPFAPFAYHPAWGAWVREVEPSPGWSWDSLTVVDETRYVYGGMVAVDDALVVAFDTYKDYSPEEQGGGGVARFTEQGGIRWRKINTYEGYDRYGEQRIALDHSGQFRVVGKAWTLDVGSQLQSCIIAW